MRMKITLCIALMVAILLFVPLGTKTIPQVKAGTLEISYEYNSLRICTGAKATMDGILVGKAHLEDLVKGQYYLVREIHYSPLDGSIVYEGLSRFGIAGGMKIRETKISGQKRMEIFPSWPWR